MVAFLDEQPADTWVHDRLLVRTWTDMKEEILRHKWLESEKAGQDIGWERARVSWMVRHRADYARFHARGP